VALPNFRSWKSMPCLIKPGGIWQKQKEKLNKIMAVKFLVYLAVRILFTPVNLGESDSA
jgi:hypothetical protein